MDPVTKIFELAVDEGLNYAIKTVVRELDYLVHYRDHVNNLHTHFKELERTMQRAKHLVDVATWDLHIIEADVKNWRDCAEKITIKANELLLRGEDQAKMTCCNGLCPNLKCCYLLGKEASQIGSEVQEINKKWMYGNNNVGHLAPIEGRTALYTEEYYAFKSRESVWIDIMEQLKNDSVRMIGIHGSGGVGKTMLVKNVARRAKEDKLFIKILVIDVSGTPNFDEIQESIAFQLGLSTFPRGHRHLGADLLRDRLMREKKILVIVDNIWKRSGLDLEDLGIAFGKDQKGCKFLLTSREESVLKIDMNIKKIFRVKDLEEAEAIDLFKKIVFNLSETPQNQDTVEESSKKKYMVEVVKECAGLPLAIRTVANSLKDKSLIHWEAAMKNLKMSNPIGMDRRHDGVFRAIRLSFDSLKNMEQSLFLLCGLHAENHDINMDYLLRHGVGCVPNDIYDAGLGMFQGSYTMDQARTSLKESIHYLKDCCLLLDGNDSGTIKMHDIIRDVAINIAKEKYMFIVKEPLELEGRSKSKDLIAFSLPYGYVGKLPEGLVCPKLKYFFLVHNDIENELQIPSRFFAEVKELSVLSLNGVCLPSCKLLRPFLKTLQTLCLVGCKLDKCKLDSVIGGMKDLKVLSLSRSNIELLPKKIGSLTRLQLLDLGNCSKLKVIPPGVLSKLTRLNELYIENSFNQWEVEERNMKESNASVLELDDLSHLTTLNIHVPNARILPNRSCFKNLVRYKILIGKNLDWTGGFEMSTTLKINIDSSFQFEDGIKTLMKFQFEDGIKTLLKKCGALSLGKMEDVNNFLYQYCDGFPKLNYLDIKNNAKIRYIISSIDLQYIAFPVLESISLKNVSNLEMICHGRLAVKSCPKLRKVYVERCDSLKFVLSSSMAECFSQLQEMVLHRCNGMDAIVNDDRKMDKIVFTQLCNLQLRCVPELKGFSFDVDFRRNGFSNVLFNEKVAFPKLETLNIDKIDHLKMIWHDQLKSDSFCKLKKLYVTECQSLINIFPANMLGSLDGLEELRISNCESTVEVFAMQGINAGQTHDITFQLKYLNLRNLPKLEFIWSLDPQAALKFQYLHEVKVCDCVSLKSLFPAAVAKHLADLSLLEIYNCGVEEIVGKGAGVETPKFEFPQLTSLTLEQLPELKSFYPGKYELKWPLLKELKICNCDNLKIFGSENTSQQTPFLILKETFPHLEELILEWENPMTQTYIGIPDELLCKLRILELNGAPFEEICRDQHAGTFDHLTQLKLSKMHGLKHLWKENSEPRSFKLQKLEVSECDGLKTFVPSSISFQNLKKLKVSICHGLISLVSSSTATSLVHLTKMEISECKSMREIVANEGSEAVDEITFRQLKSLKLHSLVSLTSFHLGNCTIIFTSLEELIVTRCPQLKIFSNGVIIAPKLKGVKLAK